MNTLSISYGITVCNEVVEVKALLEHLQPLIRNKDEIVILFDERNGTDEVKEVLNKYVKETQIKLYSKNFNNHFGEWKNLLNEYCTKDFIFQIDADEIPSDQLIINLPTILEDNTDIDLFLVPRVNTVDGLTDQHVKMWGWVVNEKGWVNWPDMQWRVYRNSPSIKWTNKVHEKLIGFKKYTTFPLDENWSLYHHKHIKRQERQNSYYDSL